MNVQSAAIGVGAFTPSAPTYLSARDAIRMLRRHARLLLLIASVVMGGALAFYLLAEPRYDATTVMRVAIDDFRPDSDDNPASIREAEQLRTHQIETQIQLLGSRMVARQTVRDLALYDDPEFNPNADPTKRKKARANAAADATQDGSPAPAQRTPSPQLIERTTDRLLSAVKVAQDGQSDFINVTVSSRSPAKAAKIANKIAGNYVRLQVTERRAGRTRAVKQLQELAQRSRSELLGDEMAIAAYRRDHRIDAGPGRDADVAQMARLASELAASGAGLAEARQRASGQSAMSPLLADLRGQQSTITRRRAELSTLYGREHPDVKKAAAELAEVDNAIATETARMERQMMEEASAQGARASMLAGSLGAMRGQSLQRGIASVALADLERRAETTRALYLSLSQRLQRAEQARDSVRPDASIASAALLPTQPSFPRAGQIAGVAVGASFILGMIAMLVAEALQDQVRNAGEVQRLVNLPTFGMVPEIQGHKQVQAHLRVAKEPFTLFAEAIRRSELKLRRYLASQNGKVMQITSPLPGDGKTTMAISLAAAAVASGRTAVMVDLDLRRPGLPDVFDGSLCEKDLVGYLEGRAELDEILVESPSLAGLKAVPVRAAAEDPGHTLNSPRMATLFSRLREDFDLVIINSPPILAVGDAELLAAYADATILILRWGHTTPELLQATTSAFDAPISGIIFNRVHFAKHARLSYGDAIQHFPRNSPYHKGELQGWRQRLGWSESA